MNKVNLNYNNTQFVIQCNNEDKMKDIISKFLSKSGKSKRNICFIYNGQIINEELTFKKCANSLDRSRNYMNILVLESQNSDEEINNIIKSDYVICPQCYENSNISMQNFKIVISGCKSGHKTEDFN